MGEAIRGMPMCGRKDGRALPSAGGSLALLEMTPTADIALPSLGDPVGDSGASLEVAVETENSPRAAYSARNDP